MTRHVQIDHISPKEDASGLRSRLANILGQLDSLDSHLDSIDGKLFGERPTEVALSAAKEPSSVSVSRSLGDIETLLNNMVETASKIRNGL